MGLFDDQPPPPLPAHPAALPTLRGGLHNLPASRPWLLHRVLLPPPAGAVEGEGGVTPDQLADTTAFLFGVKRADIFSSSRVTRVAEARMALAWALRQNNWSLESIGAFLRRDHTTIIYALATIERKSARDKRLAERMAVLDASPMQPPPHWQARGVCLGPRG